VRSHAQKYVIKLCKKYNIEIRSKRKSCFLSDHLNFPYKRKNKNNILPLEKMSKMDKRILKNFNFYTKLVDIDRVEEVNCEESVFKVIKPERTINEEKANYLFSNSFPTTKQDEYLEENSEVSSQFKFNFKVKNVVDNCSTTTINNNFMINTSSPVSNFNFAAFNNFNSNSNNDNNFRTFSFSQQVLNNGDGNHNDNFDNINSNQNSHYYNSCGFGNMYSNLNNNINLVSIKKFSGSFGNNDNANINNNNCRKNSIKDVNSYLLSDLNDLIIDNFVNISFLRKANIDQTFSDEYISCLDFFRERAYNDEGNKFNKSN